MLLPRDVNTTGKYYSCDVGDSAVAANCCGFVGGAYTNLTRSRPTCNVTYSADLSKCITDANPQVPGLGCSVINSRLFDTSKPTYNCGVDNSTAGLDCCRASGGGAYVWQSVYDAPGTYRCNDIVNLDKLNTCLTSNQLPVGCTVSGGSAPDAARASAHVSTKALFSAGLLTASFVAGMMLNA